MGEKICIDDKNILDGIPGWFWIKEGEKVHGNRVSFYPLQEGELYESVYRTLCVI